MVVIDVRGLSCPQPVVDVQKELDKGLESFEILIDCQSTKENILRLLKRNSIEPELVEENGQISFKVRR